MHNPIGKLIIVVLLIVHMFQANVHCSSFLPCREERYTREPGFYDWYGLRTPLPVFACLLMMMTKLGTFAQVPTVRTLGPPHQQVCSGKAQSTADWMRKLTFGPRNGAGKCLQSFLHDSTYPCGFMTCPSIKPIFNTMHIFSGILKVKICFHVY